MTVLTRRVGQAPPASAGPAAAGQAERLLESDGL
jgi:hypothetical protein